MNKQIELLKRLNALSDGSDVTEFKEEEKIEYKKKFGLEQHDRVLLLNRSQPYFSAIGLVCDFEEDQVIICWKPNELKDGENGRYSPGELIKIEDVVK